MLILPEGQHIQFLHLDAAAVFGVWHLGKYRL